MNKKYGGRLTEDERQPLVHMPTIGKTAAYTLTHAPLLLQVDANGPPGSDESVANAFRCHGHTVRNVRQRFVAHGLEAALARKKQHAPSRSRLLDGGQEAPWLALRGGPPPPGQAQWTFQVLADQRVALHVVETLSYEPVRQTLNKTASSRTCTRVG